MNQRERFLALYDYQPVDRTPIWDFGFWSETLVEWRKQGLPEDVKPDDFFGMDRQWESAPYNNGLLPLFERKVLEDGPDFRVVQCADGVIAREAKDFTSMPDFVGYTLKDRASWEEHYKWRLNPDTPGRIGENFFARLEVLKNRDYPAIFNCGSVLGVVRNWFGLENFSYIQFDDPKLFAEVVETTSNCIAVTMERALAEAKKVGVTFDLGHFWEDICYNHGPLIHPKAFNELAVPQVRRITDLGRKYGINLFSVDCDGKVDELILPWRKAGLSMMFPIEIGDWADPVELRKRFGKELLMMGGIDKRVLATTRARIDAMIDHLTPLVKEGAFLPTPDHRVPPDVSLDNYIYYLNRIKKVWGHNLSDVRPTGTPTKK